MNLVRSGLIVLMSACFVPTSVAHHSGAMFDDKVSKTLAGTVRDFQWTNPHCWIQIVVTGSREPVEWSIEMGSPSQLYKGGWRPHTLKAGDTLTVTFRPLRDGSNGGLFVSAVGENGRPLGK